MAVLIYTENRDGKFTKASFESVSFGVRIAKEMNLPAVVLSLGTVDNKALQVLGKYGPDTILTLEDERFDTLDNKAYTAAISAVAADIAAKVVLFSHSNTGKAVAPRVAARMKAAYAPALTGLPVSYNPLIVRKKVMSGKAFADIGLSGEASVLTLSPNAFEVVEKPADIPVEKVNIPVDDNWFTTRVTGVQKQTGKVILTDADIVVSGGRGMKGPENWGPIEELAGLLGAATACSRPVSDEDWRPHEEHTGQTGKIIAPNLYIACGISGAIQHLAGVSSSKYIVAINTDPDAPIFEAADYGIVGDAMKVLPALVEEVKKVIQ
ncbi:MAG: electron transfer flavoprotein subunit alpha/FixB family protein [Chlorobi bacterium]|nr:electron transfer flavoprotein subunit alpha/FixB family protein [Chlorobiota bacterium]